MLSIGLALVENVSVCMTAGILTVVVYGARGLSA